MYMQYLKITWALTTVPIDKVSTCSSILTRTGQTLINLHLTVPSKVSRLTGTPVVIEQVLEKGAMEEGNIL